MFRVLYFQAISGTMLSMTDKLIIVNKSTAMSDDDCEVHIRWVASQPEFIDLFNKERVIVQCEDKNYRGFAGIAYRRHFFAPKRYQVKGQRGTYRMVRIFCGTLQQTYPHTAVYKKRAGAQTYGSWRDEFVAVVAHELRHIEQYNQSDTYNLGKTHPDTLTYKAWGKKFCASGSVEVDAEVRAAKILKAFWAAFHIAPPVEPGFVQARGRAMGRSMTPEYRAEVQSQFLANVGKDVL